MIEKIQHILDKPLIPLIINLILYIIGLEEIRVVKSMLCLNPPLIFGIPTCQSFKMVPIYQSYSNFSAFERYVALLHINKEEIDAEHETQLVVITVFIKMIAAKWDGLLGFRKTLINNLHNCTEISRLYTVNDINCGVVIKSK